MKLYKLIAKEITHSKISFLTGILAVALSAGIAFSSILMLHSFDAQTDRVLQAKAKQAKAAWDRFEDNVRKTMLELGFNLVILQKDQTISTPDSQAKYLPESYAEKLRQAHLMSINHVLPFLKKRVWWPEAKRWVTLYGTPGEIQIKNPKKQTAMVKTVEAGKASLGRGIYASAKLKEGDSFTFMGRKYIVQECRPGESFETDEQIRVPLKDAQQLLALPGKISGIMAINCVCADPRGIAGIRQQIAGLLPDTKVLEHETHRIVRVEERARAAKEADASLKRERQVRAQLRHEHEQFSATLIPLITAIAAVWLGLITWINVRRRRPEMAVLHAIGHTNADIMILVLGKALITGLLGGILGTTAGWLLSTLRSGGIDAARAGTNHDWVAAALIVGVAVIMALIASWIPALQAAMIDPAEILNEEG